MAFISFLSACGNKGFTRAEKKVIEKDAPGIMRLVTVDDKKDLRFLHEECKDVPLGEIGSDAFTMLIQRMYATVQDPENEGVGIAAPQVGISRRLIMVRRFDKEREPFIVYVNPRIMGADPEMEASVEGCLSIPGVTGNVERNRLVIVEYTDVETLEPVQETIEGFTAVIFQHEIDHLDGILFTDRIAKE